MNTPVEIRRGDRGSLRCIPDGSRFHILRLVRERCGKVPSRHYPVPKPVWPASPSWYGDRGHPRSPSGHCSHEGWGQLVEPRASNERQALATVPVVRVQMADIRP
jgi:hypothetical protein